MAENSDGENLVELFVELGHVQVAFYKSKPARAEIAFRILHLAAHVVALLAAEVQTRKPAIGELGQNVVGDAPPATPEVQNVVPILDPEPLDDAVDHVFLGLGKVRRAFLPEPHAVLGIDQFSIPQHAIQHSLRQVVLGLH